VQSELALQRLQEARDVVDEDVAQMIDALANLVMLQQDFDRPMLGAKVTLYLRPDVTRYMAPEDDVPFDDWRKEYVTDNAEYWQQWDLEWYDSEAQEGDTVVKFAMKDDPDAPDIVEHEAIVIEGNVANDAPDGTLWDPNQETYTEASDYPLGTVNLVVAQDYHGDELISFSDGYATDVSVYTSIVPAGDEPSALQYTPGW